MFLVSNLRFIPLFRLLIRTESMLWIENECVLSVFERERIDVSSCESVWSEGMKSWIVRVPNWARQRGIYRHEAKTRPENPAYIRWGWAYIRRWGAYIRSFPAYIRFSISIKFCQERMYMLSVYTQLEERIYAPGERIYAHHLRIYAQRSRIYFPKTSKYFDFLRFYSWFPLIRRT